MIKSTLKEILELPSDTPDSMLYCSSKFKGLGLFKASWEAYIQNFNNCKTLFLLNHEYINHFRCLDVESDLCLKKINIQSDSFSGNKWSLNGKKIRQIKQNQEFVKWQNLKQKGCGVELFDEYTPANSWIRNHEGLSTSEWKEAIKMVGYVSNLRGIPGRSQDGRQCRHCTEIESLPHVLGKCQYGNLLRNIRHNTIRSLIATSLKDKFDIYEEITCIGDNDSNRRVDILALNKNNKQIGYILDPTIRFERSKNQPTEVDREKKAIYEPTINYFKNKYKINEIEVIGLFIGARGTISKFFKDFAQRFGIPSKTVKLLARETLKLSVHILKHHLYSKF